MKKVKLYTLSTCPWCMKTKQFFKNKKIAFDCVDFDLESDEVQEKILDEMRKYGNGGTFPFVLIGDVAVSGYNPDKYEELLGQKK